MSGLGARRAYAQRQRDGVPAPYPGVCERCESTWRIGDPIVKRGERWLHAACGRTDDE